METIKIGALLLIGGLVALIVIRFAFVFGFLAINLWLKKRKIRKLIDIEKTEQGK